MGSNYNPKKKINSKEDFSKEYKRLIKKLEIFLDASTLPEKIKRKQKEPLYQFLKNYLESPIFKPNIESPVDFDTFFEALGTNTEFYPQGIGTRNKIDAHNTLREIQNLINKYPQYWNKLNKGKLGRKNPFKPPYIPSNKELEGLKQDIQNELENIDNSFNDAINRFSGNFEGVRGSLNNAVQDLNNAINAENNLKKNFLCYCCLINPGR